MRIVLLLLMVMLFTGCDDMTSPDFETPRNGLEVNIVDNRIESGVVTVYGKLFGPRSSYGPDTLNWRISVIGDYQVFGEGVEFPPAIAVNVPMAPNATRVIYVSLWTVADTLRVQWPPEEEK